LARSLIERSFLEKLERLTIHWRRSFPGLVGGHNLSRFAGPGQDFLDHRHFHHGDDLRAVNWLAYMRLEKLFLKMFQIEPRVPVRILVDTSLSMAAYDGVKFDYARRLAAALAYVGLVRLDTISIHAFAARLSDPHVCSGGRHRFGPASDFLAGLKPAGASDFLQISRAFAERNSQQGLAIILSDFLGADESIRPIEFLAEFGHELFLVQIFAPEEREPIWTGELMLRDAETDEAIELDFDEESRRRYTEAFDEFTESLRRAALRHGGRHVALSTSLPVEDAVFGPMARSGALR
jgi:uncharacterized protein (DUF58 family)